MGYTIRIGNATPKPPDPRHAPGGSFDWKVGEVQLPDAPCAPNDPNGWRNYRWPSYSVWADFARDVGLYDMLIDGNADGTLMPSHPGIAPLYPWHKEQIDAALARYRQAHPNAVPKFTNEPGDRADEINGHLARLEWLAWWVSWALTNCKHPALENT